MPGSLYAKLPPGPNTLGRKEVAAHQRARLHGATIEACSNVGYAASTVAELIALAGVSRRAFYEHFDSKEACFLASYDIIVGDAVERIMSAYERAPDGLARIAGAYEAFVTELIRNPQAARLAIVDVLAIGPGALEHVEQVRLAFERTIFASSSELLGGLTLPGTVLKGVVAGIWQVARRRLLDGRLHDLQDVGPELLGWAITYNSPVSERLNDTTCTQACAASYSLNGQGDDHRRVLRTAARLAATHGYAQLTPAWIIDEAGVPLELFFESYENTEQCFLAALELLAVEALALAYHEAENAEDWAEAMQLAVTALLRHTATDPTFSRVAFVEVFATGSPGVQLREGLLARAAELFIRDAPDSQRPSPVMAEAIVGAIWGLAYDLVVRGRAHHLPALVESATYLALAPVIGAEEAMMRILKARTHPRIATLSG